METRNVFLYWVGKEYKLICILRKLIYSYSTYGKGYTVHLITDKNISNYIENIPDYFSTLCPAHQADFVRVNVIYDYGGIWLDSDTIILDSLDSLFDYIENKNGFFIKQNNNNLSNGIFGCKKQSLLMLEWKNKMIEILNEKKSSINWNEIGGILLQTIYNSNIYDNYEIFNGLDNVYPVNWNNCVTEYIDKPYDNYKTIIRDYQPLLVLVNSVYKKLENKTEEEIIYDNMPINYFINKSLENINIKNYNDLIKSDYFNDNLKILNYALKEELDKNNFRPILIGNLFYDHKQPQFYNSNLLDNCNEKRKRFLKATQLCNTMFEIGLNGGHSAFLALTSNKNLKVYSNDIAEIFPACQDIHPEIYVPIAVNTLTNMFGERFNFIKGSCLNEVPKFIKENPSIKFDLVHIDGDKSTYKKDFFNIIPSLNDNAIIIFNDTNQTYIQNIVNELILNNYLCRTDCFPQMDNNIKYRNEILIYKKSLYNKKIFENIYEKQIWNNGNINIPLSGPGSSIENTKECSQILDDFIYNNDCKSVLDLGCGDLTWISKTKFFNDSNIKYTGIDIVENLINSHLKNYPENMFLCQDLIHYNNIDFNSIIVLRDIIFHLKNDEILSIFKNIKNKFKYILITSCKNNINTDIFDKSHFSQKNIHNEPFNISNNFEIIINENKFNRNVYIYTHKNFYNEDPVPNKEPVPELVPNKESEPEPVPNKKPVPEPVPNKEPVPELVPNKKDPVVKKQANFSKKTLLKLKH